MSIAFRNPVNVLLEMTAEAPRDGYSADPIKLTPAPGLVEFRFVSWELLSRVNVPATFCTPNMVFVMDTPWRFAVAFSILTAHMLWLMLPPVRCSGALATYTSLFVPLPVRRVLLRTTSAAPFRAPRSAHPVPWITQLSTMNVTPEPEARIGPPVDCMVAPLHKMVLLTDNAYSVIV